MNKDGGYSPTWLDFELPEFTRLAWASKAHQETWQPRISRVSQAWSAIEVLSVLDGIRPCARTVVSPQSLPSSTIGWQRLGATVTPLQRSTINGYASRSQGVNNNQDWSYSVLVSTSAHVADLYVNTDDSMGGSLLGYPDCCRSFFVEQWGRLGRIDTTWGMVDGLASSPEVKVSPDWRTNMLLRPIGIRPVPHLPCSFNCEKTALFAEALMECGARHGFSQEVEWLKEILSWPVQWTALHGIAEVKTPILKFHYTTDATGEKLSIQSGGSSMPVDTAVGEGRLFRRGQSTRRRRFSWEINDFVSLPAMRECHREVEKAAEYIEGVSGFYDLGCGDGSLVASIGSAAGVAFGGCDLSLEAIDAAKSRYPNGSWSQCEIGAAKPPEGHSIILMPGRIEESGKTIGTTTWLPRFGDPPCVVYQYQHDGLRSLCERVGLDPQCLCYYQQGPSVEAAVFDARRQHH